MGQNQCVCVWRPECGYWSWNRKEYRDVYDYVYHKACTSPSNLCSIKQPDLGISHLGLETWNFPITLKAINLHLQLPSLNNIPIKNQVHWIRWPLLTVCLFELCKCNFNTVYFIQYVISHIKSSCTVHTNKYRRCGNYSGNANRGFWFVCMLLILFRPFWQCNSTKDRFIASCSL